MEHAACPSGKGMGLGLYLSDSMVTTNGPVLPADQWPLPTIEAVFASEALLPDWPHPELSANGDQRRSQFTHTHKCFLHHNRPVFGAGATPAIWQ